MFIRTIAYKLFCLKWGIVSMIMGNVVAAFFGPPLERILSFESFADSQRYLVSAMDILSGMVNK